MLNNHLRYRQSEPHPTLVNLLLLTQLAKELEQFRDCFRLNSDACIAYTCYQSLVFVFDRNCDPSLEGKLDGIANQVKKDLFEAFGVRA